ncbi:DUF349 domain-containing protein [Maribellus luteus]|uniref:DUF349 domain-containing protein n=1 Tax=Maribellus luteus TaxID=2305463 RepID=A0A399T0K4_9BACT|nr:DUF349 domain-containing protein [Maribellus luteus]RIJ47721.1 DUF349 domain-containing protein [Maribellus luteus]
MEPKDLKNSEELRSPENEDLKKVQADVVSDEVEKADAEETVTEQGSAEVEEPAVNAEAGSVEEKADQPEEVNTEAAVEEESVSGKDEAKEEASEPTPEETKELSAELEEATKEETVEKLPVAEEKAEEAPSVEKPEKQEQKKEKIDYSTYTQIELVNALRDVLDEKETRDIRSDVEVIKASFYKILKDNEEAALAKFIEEGGAEEDFQAEEDPYEKDIKELLKDYRQIRIEQNKQLEQEKEENLKKKYEVIEKIKGLINNEESINKTFNEFRDLQQEWREIGLVPQSEMKNLWDTYHFHVENFYDYIKINRELRDLDLKKNLEAKIRLCERAEELLLDPSIIKAFNTLQKYHEQWREIGPVPREQKDDIWERFKAATAKINKKHQEFFEDRKSEQKNNLDAKTALCEKVEEILEKEIATHKEWDDLSKELINLQKVWRTIGFAPRKDNNRIYERFRSACDKFFDAKRDFYSKNKEEQQNNLQLKIDLCVQAETLKDSMDWKKTTQDFINIQKKWKEIGPVPRKQSDTIWKRFRTACDYFFDKKSEHFSDVDSEQIDNLKDKEQIIEELKAFKSSEDVEQNLKQLKQFQRRWSEIGHVPFKKKDELQSTFRELINQLYDDLNIDEEKRNMLKFRTKMSNYSESMKGQNKMRMEREKYMTKLRQLENDLVLLDNNIGFFAKSKNAEALIKDVKKKIEVTKQKIEFLKDKIRVIDELDHDE